MGPRFNWVFIHFVMSVVDILFLFQREYFLTLLKRWVNISTDELDSIQSKLCKAQIPQKYDS